MPKSHKGKIERKSKKHTYSMKDIRLKSTSMSKQTVDGRTYERVKLTIRQKERRAINKTLQGISKKRHQNIPLDDIYKELWKYRFVPLQRDRTKWSGFLTGRDGRIMIDVGHDSTMIQPNRYNFKTMSNTGDKTEFFTPLKNTYLIVSWHKMESGKYEVNTYLS